MSDKIKVIYIASLPRSGSTILTNTLGQIEGFFNIGELSSETGIDFDKRKCGCGTPLTQCLLWSKILNRVFTHLTQENLTDINKIMGERTRIRNIPLLLFQRGRLILRSYFDEIYNGLEKIYKSIQLETCCNVIIDSSKDALYAYILSNIPSIELYIVHLIRDPRAVAFSAMGRKSMAVQRQMGRTGILVNSLRWVMFNVGLNTLQGNVIPKQRYIRIRYEDFVKHPKDTLSNIVRYTNEESRNIPLIDTHTLKAESCHTIGGNPIRFQTGLIEIKWDTDWISQMGITKKLLVDSLTFPWLLKYKYDIFV